MSAAVTYMEKNLIFLLTCGLYPFNHKNTNMRFLNNVCYIAYVLAEFLVFLQCLAYLFTTQTFQPSKFCFTIVYTGGAMGGLHILLHLRWNREKLAILFQLINSNFKYQSETQMQEVDMSGAIRKCTIITYGWMTLSIVSSQAIVLFVMSGSNERSLAISVWYPFNWTVSPNYEITLVLQHIMQIFVPYIYVVTDVLFPCFSLLIVGKLKILEHNFKNVMYTALINYGFSARIIARFSGMCNETIAEKQEEPLNTTEINLINHVLNTEKFENVINKQFKKYIVQHLELLDFCKEMEGLFSPILLVKIRMNMVYSCMIIAGALFSNDATYLSVMVPYMVAACVQLLLSTYFGQIVQDASLEVRNKLYECPWYMCPNSFKKLFLIVQAKTSVRINFTAGKMWKVNLESFVKFINAILSYVAVLRNIM